MLRQQQWQWLADNHERVRRWCVAALWIAFFIYAALILKTMMDKGKAQTPTVPVSDFRGKFGCLGKIRQYNMGPTGGSTPSKLGYYQDASLFRLERHRT